MIGDTNYLTSSKYLQLKLSGFCQNFLIAVSRICLDILIPFLCITIIGNRQYNILSIHQQLQQIQIMQGQTSNLRYHEKSYSHVKKSLPYDLNCVQVKVVQKLPRIQQSLEFDRSPDNRSKSLQLNESKRPQTSSKGKNNQRLINYRLKKAGVDLFKSKKPQLSNEARQNMIKVMNIKFMSQRKPYQDTIQKSVQQEIQYRTHSNMFPKKQSKIKNLKFASTFNNPFEQQSENLKKIKENLLLETYQQSYKRMEVNFSCDKVDEFITIYSIKESSPPIKIKKNNSNAHSLSQLKKQHKYLSKYRTTSFKIPNGQQLMTNLDGDKVYNKKIQSYTELMFKINFSNGLLINTSFSENYNNIIKYKVYVGGGNNRNLIIALIKRRFWLQIVDTMNDEVRFVWTQSSQKDIFERQPNYKQENDLKIYQKLKLNVSSIKIKNHKQQNKKIFADQKYETMAQKYLINKVHNDKLNSQLICKQPIKNPITNHIPYNSYISSKKGLFYTMQTYYREVLGKDPFEVLPKTYHFTSSNLDKFKQFLLKYKLNPEQKSKNTIWIVKPGQYSNRGNGIKLMKIDQINPKLIKTAKHSNGIPQTFIFQKYINNPFLYMGRKFDIRHYFMITTVNGKLKAYWYNEGYIRTSSQAFKLDNLGDPFVHLTNDAIQQNSQKYGKYEPGNKLSYTQFQRYLDTFYPQRKYNFQEQIVQKMKQITQDIVRANYLNINKTKKMNNFQIFGMDFMIDSKFKVWLIQVNSNPCLEVSCPLLSRIIPIMLEHTLRLGLDPLLIPNTHFPPNKRYFLPDNMIEKIKYSLIFDSQNQLQQTERQISKRACDMDFDEPEQQYDNQGLELDPTIMSF